VTVTNADTADTAAGDTAGSDDGGSDFGIQIFSAPSDAPRVRWHTDLISAGFIAALLFFLILVAGEGSTFDRNTLDFVGDLPGWLQWFGQMIYVVGAVYALADGQFLDC